MPWVYVFPSNGRRKAVVSDLKTFLLAGARTRLGEGRLPSDRDVEAHLSPPRPGGLLQPPFQPGSASWRGGHSVSPSRLLPAPGPPPVVRLARERWVWRRRVRCSRAEKRCPAWRAMLQESAVLSAVLDRTMFRFHRSTTWLDQAQRKAPRRLVRVKVRKQRQREDRSAQRKQRGAAEARAGPTEGD